MQVSSASLVTPKPLGSGVEVRQLLKVAMVFADEANQSFETKRAAWFEYLRMVREGAQTGEWSKKMTREQADEIMATVEGSQFAQDIAAAERTFASRLSSYARNPHEDAIKAVDSLSNKQLAFFEIGLIDKQGMNLTEWRDKEAAMSDILEVWRMVDADGLAKGSPDEDLLKALNTLYEMVGSGRTKPGAIEWPEDAAPFVKRLEILRSKRAASREPEDIVEISPDALEMLRRQSAEAWRDGSARRAAAG